MVLRQNNIYFELFDKYFDSFAVNFACYFTYIFGSIVYKLISLTVHLGCLCLILKNGTDDLRTSLDAAWVEIEALKQLEQNKLQLAELANENGQLQAEVSPTKARVLKLDNYTRRENIRLLNVPKS